MFRTCLALAAAATLSLGVARAEEKKSALDSLKMGEPDIKSAGALAFGPEGILLVGDAQGAAVFALDTGDRTAAKGPGPRVDKIDGKIGSLLGIDANQLLINGMAVNPISGNTYLSVSRGRGADAKPAIIRVDREGKLGELSLKDVKFAKAPLANAAGGQKRQEAITGIAYVQGRVLVAGLSNEEFSSRFRSIPFPFAEADKGAEVGFFHGSHGRFETTSPVRTFVAYDINGEANILAAYTCTPLVKVPVSQLKPGEKIKGTTVAELGNQNRPLDMIVYKKGGKDYILMANSARGVMKIPTEGIDKIEPITKRTSEEERKRVGLQYETIGTLKGVQHLAPFDAERALVLIKGSDGLTLQPIDLP